jgi:hypothetical protein
MKKLTTAFGAPVRDNQNIQTAGKRGPALLQDVWFLEKMAHFDPRGDSGTEYACQGRRRVWPLHGNPPSVALVIEAGDASFEHACAAGAHPNPYYYG